MAEPSKKRQKTSSKPQSNISAGPRITDPRFANIQSDPRYRLPGKRNKIKLDKRFARVLEDDDFVKRAKVDRYGRPLESKAEKSRLKRKYEFDEDQDDDEENDAPDNDDEVQKELRRFEETTRDPLREGRDTDSGSSDESSTSDEESEEDAEDVDEELNVGPAQHDDVPTGEVTSRIAIVNLDWDNIHAADLMAVFSSFLPSVGGSLLNVAIYPSEFGKERLEQEEMEGPPKEIFSNAARGGNDEDITDEEEADEDIKASILKNENGDQDFNPTALRKYQLERLRYFYAILTFSSPSVAKHIYEAVDGTEYLRTANFFDLRFVPDDTDFSSDEPREDCERMPDDYKPNEFVTDALQHSKVKLTWDADDTGRKEAAARAFQGGKAKGKKGMQEMMDENDLRAYLASDGSDDEEEKVEEEAPLANTANDATVPLLSRKEAERQRMRSLLGLPLDPVKSSKKTERVPVGDMQITFTSGLNPGKDDQKRSVFENSPELEETTLERYVRKERERKMKRKDKMKSGSVPDPEIQEDAGVETADPTNQGMREDNEDLGFNDPFFAATEPSASTEKTTSSKLRKEERLKRRKEREAQEEADRKQRAELELLMADDPGQDSPEHGGRNPNRKMKHFDMREIERAEKEERKKGKKHRSKDKSKSKAKSTDEPVEAADEFTVNTSDPRFSRLFESHEFAIDPTNPRFKGTKGMKALLDEGRKRKSKDNKTGDMAREERESRRGRDDKPAEAGEGDVKRLVEKIKRRHKS